MSIIKEYYNNYLESKSNFDTFHNEVLNMPRDEFGSAGFKKIQMLASYLLLLENEIPSDGLNYKQILEMIIQKYEIGIYPNYYRDKDFELKYLLLNNISIEDHYEIIGRMFRHLMGICAFFDLITSLSKQKKLINFESCKILTKSDGEILLPVFRNILINININNNDYIKSLSGINIKFNADYKPAGTILKYLSKINRPATLFEISLLFGRIDSLQTEKEIFERALIIGKNLPSEHEKQKTLIFKELGWINKDHSFDYAASQQPDFKFKSFILYMKDLGLVNINNINKTISLTEYSKKYVEEEIPNELLDLEDLINKIDDNNTRDSELLNLIIKKRSIQLNEAINKENSILLKKINIRALNNIEYDNLGKRKRNKFIVELSKLKANYTCQVTGKSTFKMPNGDNYVEAHHLIEFSRENGPDIVENILILGPEKHRLIHHACEEEIDDLYNHLKMIGIITYDLFKKMIEDYNCLNKEHLLILKNKKLLSTIQYEQLIEILNSNAS